MSTVIRVENVSKQYRLGKIGTRTFVHDLNRLWHGIKGQENPYLKIGDENDRTKKGNSEYVWALREISFDIEQGDVVGIIGANGAGKSTLLKILSRTTRPTFGNVKAKGRIASLLEVGTGFHPELSGRENIFLNGAILGMTKAEIRAKFDEIVAFSGVEKYIETPVKRYSSGMYVRLAFAVAAHLEPEILIIDEVLAVGDTEFQKKALGKMNEVSKVGGRTILFVSHNLRAISQLCTKGFVIEKGTVGFMGAIGDSVRHYLRNEQGGSRTGLHAFTQVGKSINLISAALIDEAGSIQTSIASTDKLFFRIDFKVNNKISGSRIGIQLINEDEEIVFTSTNARADSPVLTPGRYLTQCELPIGLLNEGDYSIIVFAGIPGQEVIHEPTKVLKFHLKSLEHRGTLLLEKWPGIIAPRLEWELIAHLS